MWGPLATLTTQKGHLGCVQRYEAGMVPGEVDGLEGRVPIWRRDIGVPGWAPGFQLTRNKAAELACLNQGDLELRDRLSLETQAWWP